MFELASPRDKKAPERAADEGERVVLVHVDEADIDAEDAIAELRELTLAAGAAPVCIVRCPARSPNAAMFIGRGKVDQIKDAVHAGQADTVIFDPPLSPGQERNLEREIECRVIDRRALILDIFARRASTFEGKLQVELAQLAHLSTRLVRGWTHLERQKGGIGLRGPGETQLETDRRLVDQRIRTVRSRLERVRSRRGLSRRSRARSQVPLVALVGYTNAGKSTLFNRLTGAATLVRDQLFATLDPTLRRLDPKGEFGSGSEIILADTVGFIRRLPPDLVAAFRATLEETREASLLVHVVDAAAADRREKMREVHEVLKAIDADGIPCIELFNKSDLLDAAPDPRSGGEEEDGDESPLADDALAGEAVDGQKTKPPRVFVSAATGEGLPQAVRAIRDAVDGGSLVRVACIPPSGGRLRSTLYRNAQIMSECGEPDGTARMTFRIEARVFARLCRETELEGCLAEVP
ncbi:MAG: GTPase HflX [Ectothiorhodospiraceae bacterium AqS1]|nr:GTPase HflX [Ectothiorhodospiraceae bacterium AqS1]